MAALDLSLLSRDAQLHQWNKRSNWAGKNAGVVVVFCIVFVIAAGLLGLFLQRKYLARMARRAER